jgi:hypothetical protein
MSSATCKIQHYLKTPNTVDSEILSKNRICLILTLTAWIAGFLTGCSKKPTSVENIRILTAVRTAVSIQSPKQVEHCRNLVGAEVGEGLLSAELEKELSSVFELAGKQEWLQAEKRIIKIQERYKPNPSTLDAHRH